MTTTPPISTFAETAALYAVLNQDTDEAERIVMAMLPNERAHFARQLDELRSLLTDRFGNELADTSRRAGFEDAIEVMRKEHLPMSVGLLQAEIELRDLDTRQADHGAEVSANGDPTDTKD